MNHSNYSYLSRKRKIAFSALGSLALTLLAECAPGVHVSPRDQPLELRLETPYSLELELPSEQYPQHIYREPPQQEPPSRDALPPEVEGLLRSGKYTPIDVSNTTYDHLIAEYSSKFRVNPDHIKILAGIESGFRPKAQSPVGAQGILQLHPPTINAYFTGEWGMYARKNGFKLPRQFNPYKAEHNLPTGIAYFDYLFNERYGRDLVPALVAWNGGPKWGDRYATTRSLEKVPKESRDLVGTFYATLEHAKEKPVYIARNP